MSQVIEAAGTGEIARAGNHGRVLVAQTSVPANGTQGYSHGCILIHLDGTSEIDAVYVNKGTRLSCEFVVSPLGTASGGLVLDPSFRNTITSSLDTMSLNVGEVTALQALGNGVVALNTISNLVGSGVAFDTLFIGDQPAPVAKTGVATITIADITSGIVTLTQATGGTVALTLDTGSDMDTGKPPNLGINNYIDWYLINLSAAAADTGTVTASSGHTIVGNGIVNSAHNTLPNGSNSAKFRSRRTAANTWITYRLG